MALPFIIQGGMGIGISNWRLAHAVSRTGQLGVVSGVGLDTLMVRRLQDGDPEGHIRRALNAFPFADTARNIINTYFVPNGIGKDTPYKQPSLFSLDTDDRQLALNTAANFTEVYLAKEGHSGPVGINFLEKIQLPTLSSIYGALLAGVDYILMGAGIPIEIPGILSSLQKHEDTKQTINVADNRDKRPYSTRFSPRSIFQGRFEDIALPKFLPIVSSDFLASVLIKKANGPIDGFVVEGSPAGGHNAPPRGKLILDEDGEPVYGKRDDLNHEKLKALGKPYWLAGSFGTHEQLQKARALGAEGIQSGSAFALCRESGFAEDLKARIIEVISSGAAKVRTNMFASPTGFPFKVLQLPGTLSDTSLFMERKRICNLGYLREAYEKEDGSIGYRCAAESVNSYVSKGGEQETAEKAVCLCNALFAAAGRPTHYGSGYIEKALVTIGSNLESLRETLRGRRSYSAEEVIDTILQGT